MLEDRCPLIPKTFLMASRPEQDAIAGLRGPPTELFIQGGSNYRSDNIRAQRPAAGKSLRPVTPNVSAVSAVLAQAEARLAECPTGPVHVYDLHETAMRLQKEMVERETTVSGGVEEVFSQWLAHLKPGV